MVLSEYDEAFQKRVCQKVEAFERFVNLNAIALGVLQVLALEIPQPVWKNFPGWFRTVPEHGYPSEQIVRLALKDLQMMIFSKSRPNLLLTKLLERKMNTSPEPDITTFAA